MPRKQEFRTTFNLTAVADAYAPEYIAFGVENANQAPDSGFLGVTAIVESSASAGARLEIWLPKAATPTTPGSVTIADYFYSGWYVNGGAITKALASYRGVLLRGKSAGVAGAMVVSASAD
jgi:hypothetical protein